MSFNPFTSSFMASFITFVMVINKPFTNIIMVINIIKDIIASKASITFKELIITFMAFNIIIKLKAFMELVIIFIMVIININCFIKLLAFRVWLGILLIMYFIK